MTMLTNRFIKFYNSLYTSDKSVINNLRCIQEFDMRSTFGSNIMHLCLTEGNFNPLFMCKNTLKYKELPNNELWRVDLVKEIVMIRKKLSQSNLDFNINELNDILFYICCE